LVKTALLGARICSLVVVEIDRITAAMAAVADSSSPATTQVGLG
jgi:hypothetical protein